MRVRDWEDVLADVTEANGDAGRWHAVGGTRAGGIGEDLYVAHPAAGVFQIKTYARNPFEVQGVGARIDPSFDDALAEIFPEEGDGGFGVGPTIEDEEAAETVARDVEQVVEAHADAPTTPDALFEDLMDALDAPAYGPAEISSTDRPDRLDQLTETFEEAEDVLDAEFEDVVDDAVDRGFY